MPHWKKLGQLFCPLELAPWMHSHAANPFGLALDKHRLRVYFTCRDQQSRSHIASIDIALNRDFELSNISHEPHLAPGEVGTFDDSGCAMGCAIRLQREVRIYYLGWNLKVTVPWLNTIGLARSKSADGPFLRHSPAPLLDRHDVDPYSISYPSILREGRRWRMWYGSNLGWGSNQEDMRHVVKYAESRDGIVWNRKGRVVVNLEHPNEFALSKPHVVRDAGGYRMWYSYRGCGDIASYRIGCAVSCDGTTWTRRDNESGIDVSAAGWDSQMICYPFVFTHRGHDFMLYNGNGYGSTGFGLAHCASTAKEMG